jgi:hypothetical protein
VSGRLELLQALARHDASSLEAEPTPAPRRLTLARVATEDARVALAFDSARA